MGWKGSEIEMPVGMIFKRMFCHKCGARLKKEKITKSSYLGKIKTGDLFTLLCTSYLSINNRIPEQIVPSLFTLTTFLQIAAIYGYYNTFIF